MQYAGSLVEAVVSILPQLPRPVPVRLFFMFEWKLCVVLPVISFVPNCLAAVFVSRCLV